MRNPNIPLRLDAISKRKIHYKTLFQGKPDAIFIFSGGIILDEKRGFRSTSLNPEGKEAATAEQTGFLGGSMRDRAAGYLGQAFTKAKDVEDIKNSVYTGLFLPTQF